MRGTGNEIGIGRPEAAAAVRPGRILTLTFPAMIEMAAEESRETTGAAVMTGTIGVSTEIGDGLTTMIGAAQVGREVGVDLPFEIGRGSEIGIHTADEAWKSRGVNTQET